MLLKAIVLYSNEIQDLCEFYSKHKAVAIKYKQKLSSREEKKKKEEEAAAVTHRKDTLREKLHPQTTSDEVRCLQI